MSTPFFRPPQESTLVIWARVGLYSAALVLLVVVWACASGCASPGKVGFNQLRRQNAREKTVVRTAAVHSARIAFHTDRAIKLSEDLAHTHLDANQVRLVEKFRLELNQVKLENTALTKQLADARDIIIQRDATITQTQAEAKEAASVKFWREIKLRVFWCGIGIVIGLLLYGFVHGMILAAKAYLAVQVPGAGVAVNAAEALVKEVSATLEKK